MENTTMFYRRILGASMGVSTPSASDRRFQQPVRAPRMAPRCSSLPRLINCRCLQGTLSVCADETARAVLELH